MVPRAWEVAWPSAWQRHWTEHLPNAGGRSAWTPAPMNCICAAPSLRAISTPSANRPPYRSLKSASGSLPNLPTAGERSHLVECNWVSSGSHRLKAAAKPFVTRYYNAGIHRAALAQPEFMHEALSR